MKWGVEVILPPDFNRDLTGTSVSKSVEEWQSMGIKPQAAGTVFLDNSKQASIIQPDGAAGRCFLAYKNYQVLLMWNRSDYFVIGVGLLADQLQVDN